ncbi:MAG: 50S ribosomal protein L17 [Bacillota bacterium]|nr:50S ribosomal protein L17 [Bacillota bacterium]
MTQRKLGRPTDQRDAMLRGLVTSLIWNGKIETTEARAKEVRSIAEKIIAMAIKEHGNTTMVKKAVKSSKGVLVEREFKNDAPSKLHARRRLMAYLYEVPEPKKDDESKGDYKKRTKDISHPVVEKLFNEIAPKYEKRSSEKGQGGGYTRIIKKGMRRGDASEIVVLELV